jgi:hypothetical protein
VTILRAAVLVMLAACAPAARPAPPLQNAARPADTARPPPPHACPPSAPTRVAARSPRLGAIAGTVVDPHCEPIAGATVFARIGSRMSRAEISDEHGQFAVQGLLPGEYVLAVFYLDSTLERGGVRVRAGTVEQVQLSMPPPAKAEPRITHDAAAAAPGAP